MEVQPLSEISKTLGLYQTHETPLINYSNSSVSEGLSLLRF